MLVSRHPLRVAVSFVILLTLIAACSKKGATTTAVPSGTGKTIEGGILRIAGDHIDTLNPFRATSGDSYATFQNIYPFLIQYNDTYDDFVPDFATSWETSPDGKTWTFTVRSGVKWSDGQPLTAEDIAQDFKMYLMPGSGWGGTVKHMETVEAPDDTTVVITYDQAVGNVLAQLQQAYFIPPQIWEPVSKDGVKALGDYQEEIPLVTGGPFILTDYKADEVVKFELNPNWYGPKPHIDGFGLQFFQNSEGAISALENGEIDLINSLAPSGVDPLKQAGLVVDSAPGAEWFDIIFNSTPNNPNNPELRDVQLRTALEYATDRQRMIDTVMLGHATPGSSIVPPVDGKWFNSELNVIPYDLDKANQVLDDAGYKMGSDGVRVSPDGTRLSYTIQGLSTQAGVDRLFEIVKEDWAKIGVQVKFKKLSYNQLWDANQEPINEKTGIGEYLDFQIIFWDWIPNPDPDFILSVLGCDQYSIWSDTGYCDPAYDKMYSDQATTVDPKARRDLVWQMQEKIYTEKPYTVLYYMDAMSAHTTGWEGFADSPQGPFNALNNQTLLDVHQVG